MKKRLIGLETEFAIRFSSRVIRRPSNKFLYDQITKEIREYTKVIDGTSIIKLGQIFTENGSSICYECLPNHLEHGLLETATPETTSPLEAVLYQKALEKLLKRALLRVNADILYYPNARITLIKNCKDAFDNIYGAQENYSVRIAERSFPLFIYRTVIFLYLLLLSFYVFSVFLITFVILFLFSLFFVFFYFLYSLIKTSKRSKYNPYDIFAYPSGNHIFRAYEKITNSILSTIEIVISFPLIFLFLTYLNNVPFRRFRKRLLPFLITRILYTGSGTLRRDGKFFLSEKSMFVRRISRITNLPAERAVFDTGNILKQSYVSLITLMKANFSNLKQLLSPEQRLQIGLSDSCMSQECELLKIGIPALLLDMIEDGFLKEIPEIKNPVAFLKEINEYPKFLTAKAIIKNANEKDIRKEMTAIEIQKWYLKKAKEYLNSRVIVDFEYRYILNLWEEVLNLLENRKWDELFGRLDWVTKKKLMADVLQKELSSPVTADTFETYTQFYELLKVVDIKYHDIYEGYYLKLEEQNLTKRIFTDEQIDKAITEPPDSEESLAKIRSLIIKNLHSTHHNIKMSWQYIQKGEGIINKIIPLKDFKKEK